MQRGNATLEVVIALVIGSVLILAIAAKQMGLFQYVSASYQRHLAHDEVMYAVHHWDKSDPGFIGAWQKKVAKELPGGAASVKQEYGDMVFSVRWQESRRDHQESQYQYRIHTA